MSDKVVGWLILAGIAAVIGSLGGAVIVQNIALRRADKALEIADNGTKQLTDLMQKSIFFGFGKGEQK